MKDHLENIITHYRKELKLNQAIAHLPASAIVKSYMNTLKFNLYTFECNMEGLTGECCADQCKECRFNEQFRKIT